MITNLSVYLKYFFISIIILLTSTTAFALENIFYTLRDVSFDKGKSDQTVKSLTQHPKLINILISQSYDAESDGSLTGKINPQLLQYAKKNNINFFALVTNAAFDQEKVHQLLTTPAAQQKLIAALVTDCKKYQLKGFQFDFEHIHVNDKNLFTSFIQSAASALQKQGCAVSVAIVPRTSDGPGDSDFLKQKFENWTGVYDYKELGKAVNFVSLMAYDQHTGSTPPGPVAGYDWVESNIKYALKYIPANKISLGIPTYSDHWYTSKFEDRVQAIVEQISYLDVQHLVNQYKAKFIWDDKQRVHYTFYPNNELNEYIFIEDATSFRDKVNLAKKYKLRGISVWRIGTEDPVIWKII